MTQNHLITLKIYEQKVKQLEYDYKQDINHIMIEQNQLNTSKLLDPTIHIQLQNMKEKIKFEQMESELINKQKINEIKLMNDTHIIQLKQQFNEGLKELTIRCESRQESIEIEYELRRRVDIHEVEERKNMHIYELISNHTNSFNQMKEYYNKITSENLNLIKTLQSQVTLICHNSNPFTLYFTLTLLYIHTQTNTLQ